MALNLVTIPFEYYGNPVTGKPLFCGKIFIGEIDKDPESFPKDAYYVQEDGGIFPAEQPIEIGTGGYVTQNGKPVKLSVDGLYSIRVRDSNGNEIFVSPLVGESDEGFNIKTYTDISQVGLSDIDFTPPRTLTEFIDAMPDGSIGEFPVEKFSQLAGLMPYNDDWSLRVEKIDSLRVSFEARLTNSINQEFFTSVNNNIINEWSTGGVNKNWLLNSSFTNQYFSVTTPADPINETPQDFAADVMIWEGIYAGAIGAQGVTKSSTTGKINLTGGSIYTKLPTSLGIGENDWTFTNDNLSNSDSTVTINGDYFRFEMTSEAFPTLTWKAEQSSTPTKHDLDVFGVQTVRPPSPAMTLDIPMGDTDYFELNNNTSLVFIGLKMINSSTPIVATIKMRGPVTVAEPEGEVFLTMDLVKQSLVCIPIEPRVKRISVRNQVTASTNMIADINYEQITPGASV